MNARLLELATRRGVLQANIAAQRAALAQHAVPLQGAFKVADLGLAGVDWLKQHPVVVGGAVTVLALLRPRRAWRWAKRGLLVWRGWQGLRGVLSGNR